MPAGLSGVEPLTPDHDVELFDCGDRELSAWLRTHALANHLAGFTRTFVVHRDRRVVGFSALAMASVQRERTPKQVGRAGPRAVPVALLARLAVDLTEQGTGLGAALLKDAILRAAAAAEEVGARAMLAHAKDETARAFYEHFGFRRSPTDELHMYLRLDDVV
jgi:GNAT superfamily N-acetyltransferase